MIRLLLNLMLVISFLANGLAGASAQAQMDRPACEHTTTAVDHAAMGHAGHQEALATLAPAEDQAPVAADECCGGNGCQCGCTLPTVGVAPSITLAPQVTASEPYIALVAHAATRRSAAPFRPPSV